MTEIKPLPDNPKLWDALIKDGIDPESEEGQDILWEAIIKGLYPPH